MRAMMEVDGNGAQPHERTAEQHELHDSDRRDSWTTSNAAPTKKKKYKSKYDRLDCKWSNKMATLEGKIDRIASALVPSRTKNGGENSDHVNDRRVDERLEPQRHLLDQFSVLIFKFHFSPASKEGVRC